MKSKKRVPLVFLGVIVLFLLGFKNETKITLANQDSKTIIATFDGVEDYGYNFIFINNEKEERTITFQIKDEAILKAFDLKSESLIGIAMQVTYSTVIETEKDDDGFDNETEILTISKLEQIKK